MATMALDTDWDLSIDAAGNLALIDGGAELAQSVCNAVRVWRGFYYGLYEPRSL